MRAEKQLIPGRFYWVIPEVDPDAEDRDLCEPGHEWQDEIQPARFNGWNAAGEMLWNFLGFDGSSDWPVLWVGEAIGVPIVASRCPVLDVKQPARGGLLETSNHGHPHGVMLRNNI